MNPSRPGPGPPSGPASTANEAFKAGWRARLHWSVATAAAIHAAVFAFFPALERHEAFSGASSEPTGLEVVPVDEGSLPSAGGMLATLTVEEEPEEPEPEPERPAPDDDGSASDAGGAPEADAALEELRRRTAALPGVVEPEPAPEPGRKPEPEPDEASEPPDDAANGDRSDGARIREAEVSLSDSRASEENGAPELDRLRSLRPELAFGSPESWILIRNPSEVGRFLERRFGDDAVESAAPGMLGVAIWVDDRGSVEWAEVHRSSGDRELDESAIELFTEVASFRPARERGVRVPLAVIFWLPYPW